MITGHIDLPPPGYDQVLWNRQLAGSTTTSSPPSSVSGGSSMPQGQHRVAAPSEKGKQVSVAGQRPLPETPP